MFQIDSDIVRSVYLSRTNYKIEYDERCTEKFCAVYFSSNDIYYPNTEEILRKRIVEKDFFEWYHTRVKAQKHIFVRDVFKQWYLEGINADINSPERMEEWLRQETDGYEVVTIGSSAGGYGAVLYGSLLHARRVIAFNAQYSLEHLAEKSSPDSNPLIWKYRESERCRYFRLREVMTDDTNYWYFVSTGCDEDMSQYRYISAPPSMLYIAVLLEVSYFTSWHTFP